MRNKLAREQREGLTADISLCYYFASLVLGAIAQLGERIAGSDEVRGSIPLGSTKTINSNHFIMKWFFLLFWWSLVRVQSARTE